MHKSILRINEKKVVLEDAERKLSVIQSVNERTKRSIQHSHRLVDCLDEVEEAKRGLLICQSFHKIAGSARYRIQKNYEDDNIKSICLETRSKKKYNIRPNKNCIKYTNESDEEYSDNSTWDGNDVQSDVPSEDDTSDESKVRNEVRHRWVHDLKKMDNESQPFFSKCLVILRGSHKHWEKKDWEDITTLSNDIIQSVINEVIFIQRSDTCQLYIAQGLHNSLHFSLGSNGIKSLKEVCDNAAVTTWKGSNTKQHLSILQHKNLKYIPRGLYVKSAVQSFMSQFELGYKKLMGKVASGLWTTLFRVSSSNNLILPS